MSELVKEKPECPDDRAPDVTEYSAEVIVFACFDCNFYLCLKCLQADRFIQYYAPFEVEKFKKSDEYS